MNNTSDSRCLSTALSADILLVRVPVVPGTGRVTVPSVLEAVEQDTCLVTIMMANNETGVLQPVAEIFKALKERPPNTLVPPILHTDAAQAVGKVRVNVNELCADLVTIAGHKFYAPKVGALYHRSGVTVTPMFYGGGQEVRRNKNYSQSFIKTSLPYRQEYARARRMFQ